MVIEPRLLSWITRTTLALRNHLFGRARLIMLAVIGIFYVAREHYGHLSQALPYLILLLCPLMHLFGHNHGGHSHSSGAAVSKDEDRK